MLFAAAIINFICMYAYSVTEVCAGDFTAAACFVLSYIIAICHYNHSFL